MNHHDIQKYCVQVLDLKTCDNCDDIGILNNKTVCRCVFHENSITSFLWENYPNEYEFVQILENFSKDIINHNKIIKDSDV